MTSSLVPSLTDKLNGQYGSGSNQVGVRQYNERLILQIIRQAGPLPKAEIARATQLSPQTVSVIINQFLTDGLLRKETAQKGRVGQPSVPIALARDGAYSIGIKIGRQSLDCVLMGFTGEILARNRRTYTYPTIDAVMGSLDQQVADLIEPLSAEARSRVLGAGIAAPFSLNQWADELGAPQEALDAWADLNLAEAVSKRLGMPSQVINDATSACVAELVFGQGAQYSSHLYFFLGTFIGGGIVVDGRLYQGQFGNAGALGSLPLGLGQGQLISQASIIGLEKSLQKRGLTIAQLDQAPELLQEWIDQASNALAYAVVSACAVIDFGAVLIDTSLPTEVRQALVKATDEAIGTLNLQGLHRPQIQEGSLGYEARVRGGALLPLYENFAPHPGVLTKL